MEQHQKINVDVDSKMKTDNFVILKNAPNIIFICILVFGGIEVGDKLATLFYYDVLNLVDPYQGATTSRILLTSLFSGVVSSILVIFYGEFFKVEYKYIYYVIAYVGVIIFMVMRYIVVYREFPIQLQFWGNSIGVLIVSASIIIIGFFYIKNTQCKIQKGDRSI